MKILADANLPGLAAAFNEGFHLSTYHNADEVANLLHNQDILLCRSTLKVTGELLQNHPLKFVATASSGTDHIDHQYLDENNIRLIDAKGCNAISVADYVLSCLAHLEQQHLLLGKKVGVIGMGKVGTEVTSRLKSLDFQLIGYDPLHATYHSVALEELYSCDVLCVHAELHKTSPHPSFHLINQEFMDRLKPGCVLINAARGGIVNEEDLISHQKNLIYCTDVYLNEPKIDKRIIKRATLCTPHIAGHSLEAKYAAVALVSEQLHNIMGLTIPQFATPTFTRSVLFQKEQTWQERILSMYNPLAETLSLKLAEDKELAFLSLRKQHQNRHDFNVYLSNSRTIS